MSIKSFNHFTYSQIGQESTEMIGTAASLKGIPLSGRTGKLPYTLKNDYLFKAVLQTYPEILHALLCSLLHRTPEELPISSIKLSNPIILGTAIDDKGIMLDIKLILGGKQIVNLEMQVINYHDWPERSLLYLCRIFDNLKKGEKSYLGIFPAHHIGILDFKRNDLSPKFYSHFFMMDEKTYEKYSDKFCLSVLNLPYTELATKEDKRYGLDQWAALFNAATWEELKMLAMKNPIFEKAADAIYALTADEQIREQCLRREQMEAETEWRESLLEQAKEDIQQKDARIAELEAALSEARKSIKSI